MADDAGLDDRTEDATPQKRDEWRKEGNVAQSKELVAALLLMGTLGALYVGGSLAAQGMWNFFVDSFHEVGRLARGDWTVETIVLMARYSLKGILLMSAPVFIAALCMGVLGSVGQFGIVFTTKPLELDPNKLNPMNGLQRIFSAQGIFELAKAVFKLVVVSVVLWFVFVPWIKESGTLWSMEAGALALFLGQKIVFLLFAVGLAMLILALVDFGFQKFQYERKIRMTKEEVKQERKQSEGNPQIKARVRALQRSISQRRMMDAVKKADVVVTNPTHIAIALIYDRESMLAPRIVAKGADHMAERIKKIARENGVPCVENVPLARAMYKALKVGEFITRDLYNAVAEVLAYVYRLRGMGLNDNAPKEDNV